VTAAQERVDASSRERFEGAATRPASSKTPYSRRVPSMAPPRPVTMLWELREPAM
jgi:hypothetical protein